MNSRVFYTLIRLAVVCAALGLAAGCDDVSTAELKTPVYKTGLKDSDDNKTSAFRKDFPLQAASYDRNNESTFMSKYKGSVNFMKNDDVDPLPEGYKQAAQPYLKNLWLGYPFMYEYREARGHTYAIHDILEIDRINRYGEKGGMPATCWNCKTPKMVQWIKQYGDDFWAKDFNQFRTEVTDDDSIGCATCHNAETMQLQLYSEPLKDYLKSVGKDPAARCVRSCAPSAMWNTTSTIPATAPPSALSSRGRTASRPKPSTACMKTTAMWTCPASRASSPTGCTLFPRRPC